MGHRLDPLISRIYDEHREFLAHGAGIPIRRMRVDAGTVAICGDRDQLDRRGRHAVTYVRPDQRLVILDLVDEADEAEHCVRYQHAELADLEPFTVVFRGKLRQFQATSKSFLMGACDCGDATILVSSLDGGLAFNICTREGWTCVLEPRPDLLTPMDLDAELGGRRSRASKPRTRARAVHEPAAGSRARARYTDDFDDEVREHHARLCQGVTADPDSLKILGIYLNELSRQALLPHECFEGIHQSRKELTQVVAGLLHAAARGCESLGGREMDMREQLETYGVGLLPGALSRVMQLFLRLRCPLVSQPKPTKGHNSSKRWNFDLGAALNPTIPEHLKFLKSIQTPLCPPRSVEPQDGDGGHCDEETDESGKPAAPASPRATDPAQGSCGAPSEPDGKAGPGAEPSARQTRSTVPLAQLKTFMQIALGAFTLLANQAVILHQRVEAIELAISQAVRGHVETATAAEEHGEPVASVDADPTSGAGVVDTVTSVDQIDLNATTTADAEERPGDQFTSLPARGLVETTAVDSQPGPDEINANTSLRTDDEREEHAEGVDAEPPAVADVADAPLLATASGWSASTAHTITWPADLGAGAPIEGEFLPEHTDSPTPSIAGLHEANIAVLIQERTLDLDRWNFATVMFLVMFELEDPYLIRLVALKVIAWMAEAEERVELTWATPWPRALHLPGARLQSASLACAERLNATQAWVPAQAELNAGPRGPPPLGC